MSCAVATQAFYLPPPPTPQMLQSLSHWVSTTKHSIPDTASHHPWKKPLMWLLYLLISSFTEVPAGFFCNLSLLTSPDTLALTLLFEDGGGPRIFDPNAICDTCWVLLLCILHCPLLTKLPKIRKIMFLKKSQYLQWMNINTFFKSTEIKELWILNIHKNYVPL